MKLSDTSTYVELGKKTLQKIIWSISETYTPFVSCNLFQILSGPYKHLCETETSAPPAIHSFVSLYFCHDWGGNVWKAAINTYKHVRKWSSVAINKTKSCSVVVSELSQVKKTNQNHTAAFKHTHVPIIFSLLNLCSKGSSRTGQGSHTC